MVFGVWFRGCGGFGREERWREGGREREERERERREREKERESARARSSRLRQTVGGRWVVGEEV